MSSLVSTEMLISGVGGHTDRRGVDEGPGGERMDVMLLGDPCRWDEEFWETLEVALEKDFWWVVVPLHRTG